MNIFVLCTGRCGSLTFVRACQHITNYTCGHESRSGFLGSARFEYPADHIEADNRLAWLLGRLERTFGDTAFYVHLRRDRDATAHSFVQRNGTGIMRAYRGDGIVTTGGGGPETEQTNPQEKLDAARDYYDTVAANIEFFLRNKSMTMALDLESLEEGFLDFWERSGAHGDLEAAIEELKNKHNSTSELLQTKKETFGARALGKARRLAAKFPKFVRNA